MLAFWRAAFACVVLLPLVRRPQWSWKLMPMTATFAPMNYTYLTAMAKGSAANAIWLQCTAPVWVLIVGVLCISASGRAGAIGCCWRLRRLGVGIILFFESRGGIARGRAVGPGFRRVLCGRCAVAAATAAHGVGLAGGAEPPGDGRRLARCRLPLAARRIFPAAFSGCCLAGLGMVQMGLPYVLFRPRPADDSRATKRPASVWSEPLLVPLWVFLAWGDKPAWWTLVGGGLILVGLAVRYAIPAGRKETRGWR